MPSTTSDPEHVEGSPSAGRELKFERLVAVCHLTSVPSKLTPDTRHLKPNIAGISVKILINGRNPVKIIAPLLRPLVFKNVIGHHVDKARWMV